MRKKLHINRNKINGYFLPYVLFVCMLVFMNITTVIILYENKISTERTMAALVEVETLIQMSKAKFLHEEVYNYSKEGNIIYQHPNGYVTLRYYMMDESKFNVAATIVTLDNSTFHKSFVIDI